MCRIAYAAPTIEINGNYAATSGGVEYKGYMVVDCPNEYIATLVLIDEYSSLVQIDSEVYAKLMSESHGGRFYELLQEWQKVGTADGVNEYWPSWAGSLLYQEGIVTVYGYGRVWGCAVTDALIQGAKEDFNTILGGGSLGGGGPVQIGNQFIIYGSTDFYRRDSSFNYYGTWNGTKNYNSFVWTFNLSNNVVTWINNNIENYPYVYALKRWASNTFTAGQTSYFQIWMSKNQPVVIGTPGNVSITVQGSSKSIEGSFAMDTTAIGNFNSTSSRTESSLDFSSNFFYSDLTAYFGGSGSDEPVPTPPEQPTDPTPPSDTVPTPPTVNPPSSPTPPTTTPYNPTYPTPPTNTTPPTGTSPNDYTPWLQAILQQLNNITSYLETCFTWLDGALESHCQHLRDHMTSVTQWLGGYLVDSSYDLLDVHHTYLASLAQWIVDNLRWENSGSEFDDSNMIYWLRRIYARQGSGDVNSRPVDPATDYSGFSGWLGVLYDAVALDVSDTSLVALTSSLSGLQHTFPFSLPWDIKQVLQALDVSPVTPSATFTIPKWGYVEGSFTIDAEPYNRYTYDIDLHWMDSAMVSVRAFELLVFIVYVMVHTKDLFGYLMGE